MNVLWRHKLKQNLLMMTYTNFMVQKLVRDSQNPKNMDNPIDVIGYGEILWQRVKVAKINVDYQLNMKSRMTCSIFVRADSCTCFFRG